MTLEQVMAQAEQVFDTLIEDAREREEEMLVRLGASDAEIVAAQRRSDVVWGVERERQLRRLRQELAGWLLRGDATLN